MFMQYLSKTFDKSIGVDVYVYTTTAHLSFRASFGIVVNAKINKETAALKQCGDNCYLQC